MIYNRLVNAMLMNTAHTVLNNAGSESSTIYGEAVNNASFICNRLVT